MLKYQPLPDFCMPADRTIMDDPLFDGSSYAQSGRTSRRAQRIARRTAR